MWESEYANKCKCGKESQNIDQPKNIKEKSLRKASLLTYIFYQFLNTIQSPSNYSGSKILILFLGLTIYHIRCSSKL